MPKVSLKKNQRKCTCSKCSKSPAGYQIKDRHTREKHRMEDKLAADRAQLNTNVNNASQLAAEQENVSGEITSANNMTEDILDEDIFDESIIIDANNEIVDTTAFNDYMDLAQIDDFDYMNDEEEVEDDIEMEDINQSYGLFNIGQTEALAYFIMIFLVFFGVGTLSVSSTELLFKFMGTVLSLLNSHYQFPVKLTTIKKRINTDFIVDGVRKYVVCSKCNAIYDSSEIIDGSGTIKTCSNEPNPSTNNTNKYCGNPLVIKGSNNKVKPIKRFAYNSIKNTLRKFFMRPVFEIKIEEWRDRKNNSDVMFDVFDGVYFNEFKKQGENDIFISQKRSLMFSLNVDWFTPTKTMNYHVGGIYLVINNLPRDERFKRQNMILVGLIPGPHEPSLSEINHFLRPMVDELLELYEGVTIPTASNFRGESVRCALAMVCCDIPAAKKVAGFTAFNSSVPCHKCANKFPSQVGTPLVRCFGNVDCDTWNLRDKATNYEQALMWKNAKTTVERKAIEQEYGVRWSELHRLHYFDVVRCTIVDGLHNLYLGTAKRMMDHWKNNIRDFDQSQQYITKKDLVEMAVEATKITVPPQFTTLGSKIGANFSGLKGDEYRSWTLVYSAVLLKGRLVGNHMRNWMLFVRANRILSAPAIKPNDIEMAHNMLKQFVANNVELYGENFITPNMHLHLHLHQTIRDFGPIYSTWLYSFERANGDIKEIDTNFKNGLEITYMEKYLHHVHLQDYMHILPNIIKSNQIMMDMLNFLLPDRSHTTYSTNQMSDLFDIPTFLNNTINKDVILTGTEPLPASCLPLTADKVTIMNKSHYKCLVAFYTSIYSHFNMIDITDSLSSPSSNTNILVNTSIKKFTEINLLGQQFQSLESRTSRGAFIQANTASGASQIGRILYFFTHNLTLPSLVFVGKEDNKKHIFAFVQWYEANDMAFRSFDDHYIEVWKQTFKPIDATSILPVQQIGTCVAVMKYIDNNILAIPLPRRIIGC